MNQTFHPSAPHPHPLSPDNLDQKGQIAPISANFVSRRLWSTYVTTGAALLAMWRQLPRGWWVLPSFGLALCLMLVSGQGLSLFVGKYAWTGKDFQEVLGPSILAAAVALSAYLWWVERHLCRAWMICLPAALFCRELHFSGTGTGIYVVLVAIAIYAVRHRQQLQPVWNCHLTCSLWLGAISWYALAVGVDSGIFKFVSHSHWWSVNLEETLESGGHLAILLGVLTSVLMLGRQPNCVRTRRMAAVRLQQG